MQSIAPHCGRLAPSPTGYLHAGHALTFWRAQERCRERGGTMFLRIEDLDRARSGLEFRETMYHDLRWFGLRWEEPPIPQSEPRPLYLAAWRKLRDRGLVYPCTCSRRDVLSAAGAPHAEDEEPIDPGSCRPNAVTVPAPHDPTGITWRFRVPEGETLDFVDQCAGLQRSTAGRDFGDFVIWRKDDVPAYQLAVVVVDAAMEITEARARGRSPLSHLPSVASLPRARPLPAAILPHATGG